MRRPAEPTATTHFFALAGCRRLVASSSSTTAQIRGHGWHSRDRIDRHSLELPLTAQPNLRSPSPSTTTNSLWTGARAGLSLKTQIVYAIVFTCRYLDLFTNFYSMYNTVLKVG